MAKVRWKLLVVDEDKSFRDGYRRRLPTYFEVVDVASAAEAVERLTRRAFDLVISGESVADMDGFAFLARLRELEIRVPAILLTENFDNASVLRAEDLHALCLAKPIDAETLTMAVRARIGSPPPSRAHVSDASWALETVTATYAKQEFRRVMDTAAQSGGVVITKFQEPRAVLLSFDEYERLRSAREPALEQLAMEFDQLLAAMQTPEARDGTSALFSMSSSDLGEAAALAAKKFD